MDRYDAKIGYKKLTIKNIGVFKLKSLHTAEDIDELSEALKLKLR